MCVGKGQVLGNSIAGSEESLSSRRLVSQSWTLREKERERERERASQVHFKVGKVYTTYCFIIICVVGGREEND